MDHKAHFSTAILILWASVALAAAGGDQFTGYLWLTGDEQEFRQYNGSNYLAFKASSSLAADYTWIWPTCNGVSTGQQLQATVSGSTITVSWEAAGGGGGAGDIDAVGDAVSGSVFTADGAGTQLWFEGSTADDFETLFTVTDPTADRTYTFRDATGTVLISGDTLTGDVTATFDTDGSTATALANDTVAVAEFLGSQDWGDMSTAVDGTVSLDNDIVSTDEMANADHGDFTYSGGSATLDTDSVADNEIDYTNVTSADVTHTDCGALTVDGATILGVGGDDNFSVVSDGIDIDTSGNITNAGTIGCGTITSSGNLVISDAGNIGSASDTDAIAIAADGKTTFTQDLTVNEDIIIGDAKYIGSASDPDAIQIEADGDVVLTQDLDVTGTLAAGATTIDSLTVDAGDIVVDRTGDAVDGMLYVIAGNAKDAIIELHADKGDDNNDKWQLQGDDNSFRIRTKQSGAWQPVMSWDSAGNWIVTGLLTMSANNINACGNLAFAGPDNTYNLATAAVSIGQAYAAAWNISGPIDFSPIDTMGRMRDNPPRPKPEGSHKEFKPSMVHAGLYAKEVDPATLPREITAYYAMKMQHDNDPNNPDHPDPDTLTPQHLPIAVGQMASWNYQTIYNLIQIIDDLTKRIEELEKQ